jgi:hypothetical protein
LFFRRLFIELAPQKGWNDEDILMAETINALALGEAYLGGKHPSGDGW